MWVSSGWLLLIFLSPVLSMIPALLLWQGLLPLAALWQRLRLSC